MTPPADDPASTLARRLKELRTERWPGVRLTQGQLADVLRVSTASISAWEKAEERPPPPYRLAAYAAFFATRRSVASSPYRLLPVDSLTTEENDERERLEHELLQLHDAVLRTEQNEASVVGSPLGGTWWFPDGSPVTIACSELPPEQLTHVGRPVDASLAYGQLYGYADIDALLELHGHIRAANPTTSVFIRKASELRQGDYANHLVALGGVDWNALTRGTLPRLSPPIRQVSPSDDPRDAYFEVDDGEIERFHAELDGEGELLSDVGLLIRAPSPFHADRTITICCAMYSLGVRGMVTALTDELLRVRNENYLATRFAGTDAFAILSRIPVVAGKGVAPDWTQEGTILRG